MKIQTDKLVQKFKCKLAEHARRNAFLGTDMFEWITATANWKGMMVADEGCLFE